MAELRRELTIDVRDVSRSARELASPMYYIRNYPWASAALAAGIGYLLVPKKKHVVKPDPEMLAELVRNQQVKVDTSKVEDKQSMIKGLVVMGLSWGLKTGINYAIQQLTTAATAKATQAAPEQPQPQSPNSPAEETWKTSR
jgi:hypothetical protein